MAVYKNIVSSGGVTQELIKFGSPIGEIRSISIANIDSTATATSLFLQNNPPTGQEAETIYIIKNVQIPAGATLIIDDPGLLGFNQNISGLYVTLDPAKSLDIIIN